MFSQLVKKTVCKSLLYSVPVAFGDLTQRIFEDFVRNRARVDARYVVARRGSRRIDLCCLADHEHRP